MIDPREALSKEWTSHLLSVTFTPPRGLSEEAQTEWARDLQEAVKAALPKQDRETLLDLAERARKRLREKARTVTWPSVSEVLAALRAVCDEAKRADDRKGNGGWPHGNSELVIERTIVWLRSFGEWPTYLEHPKVVAQEVIARTAYTMTDLIRAGYQATPVERREAGVVHGPRPQVEPQRMTTSETDFV